MSDSSNCFQEVASYYSCVQENSCPPYEGVCLGDANALFSCFEQAGVADDCVD